MNKDEFCKMYHHYKTPDRSKAEERCKKVNAVAEGFKCVVIELPEGFCLMTEEAAMYLKSVGAI